jgi:hypothetical protein
LLRPAANYNRDAFLAKLACRLKTNSARCSGYECYFLIARHHALLGTFGYGLDHHWRPEAEGGFDSTMGFQKAQSI